MLETRDINGEFHIGYTDKFMTFHGWPAHWPVPDWFRAAAAIKCPYGGRK